MTEIQKVSKVLGHISSTKLGSTMLHPYALFKICGLLQAGRSTVIVGTCQIKVAPYQIGIFHFTKSLLQEIL